jgi:hypothetical protein
MFFYEKAWKICIWTLKYSAAVLAAENQFVDRRIANSTWGGEEWHEMSYRIGF